MPCRLCGSDQPLVNSHIVSKFLWKLSGIIGAQKKFDAFCINDEAKSQRHQQDGFKEQLLCFCCEQRRSKFESVARKAVFGRIRALGFSKGSVILDGLDYRAIKLFTMFQLWMMGISTHPFYAHVILGPHAEKLASLLLADDPGDTWLYGSTLAVINCNNASLPGIFTQPERIKLWGHNVYRFVFAGLHCFFFVSSHAPERECQSLFLQKDGTWPIFSGPITDYPHVMQKIRAFKKFVQPEPAPTSALFPTACGLATALPRPP
jgi:hypothetical protein